MIKEKPSFYSIVAGGLLWLLVSVLLFLGIYNTLILLLLGLSIVLIVVKGGEDDKPYVATVMHRYILFFIGFTLHSGIEKVISSEQLILAVFSNVYFVLVMSAYLVLKAQEKLAMVKIQDSHSEVSAK